MSANSGPSRNGAITIAGQTFSVTQASGCSYSVSPGNGNYGPGGGPGSFNVYSGAGCGWSATSGGYSWITITSGASGSGNGTVTYSVAGNSGPDRYGFPAIDGQTPYIYQGSYQQPTCLTMSPTSSFAGIDPSNIYFCNGANMTVWVQYQFTPWGTGTPQYLQDIAGTTDWYGWIYRNPLPQNTAPGSFVMTAVRNNLRSDWYYLSAPYPQSTVRPPKPYNPAVVPDYKGIRYDIYEVTTSVRCRQDQLIRTKTYYFDTKTGYLQRAQYYDRSVTPPLRIETRFSMWGTIDGSAYPAVVERYEGGRLAYSFIATGIESVPALDPGKF